MVTKKKPPQDVETARKAYLICLAHPFNNTLYNSAAEIETLLDLLQQAKTDAQFKQALQPLIKFCERQIVAAQHLTEIVKSMGEEPPPPEKPNVH